jgi:hypothetical protein
VGHTKWNCPKGKAQADLKKATALTELKANEAADSSESENE